jgi:MerR family transcriptional regulator, thiopeptide resistance regulator
MSSGMDSAADQEAGRPTYTVGEVARLAGVTVRTLHHYDEIGLLPPSGRAANGYRTYTDVDVARLQRVLGWRELGFDLEQVAALVSTDGSPGAATDQLRRQHELLLSRIHRLQAVAATVAKTLEAHEMGINLTPEEMLEVFGDHDPTQHAAEAEQRWGDTDAFRESQRRASAYTKDDWLRIKHEGEHLNEAFAATFRAGRPVDSPEAARVATEHRAHISRWFYEVSPQMHAGLAQMYVDDPRFAATYDDVEPGLARYVREAILALYPSESTESHGSSGS